MARTSWAPLPDSRNLFAAHVRAAGGMRAEPAEPRLQQSPAPSPTATAAQWAPDLHAGSTQRLERSDTAGREATASSGSPRGGHEAPLAVPRWPRSPRLRAHTDTRAPTTSTDWLHASASPRGDLGVEGGIRSQRPGWEAMGATTRHGVDRARAPPSSGYLFLRA